MFFRSSNVDQFDSLAGLPESRVRPYVHRILMVFYGMLLFCIIGALTPLFVKEWFPRAWGVLEGVVGWDCTGFCFSPLYGRGPCRIDNTRAALESKDSRIVLGMVTTVQGNTFEHLWAVDKGGGIIDTVCPMQVPDCRTRRAFAVINPRSLSLEQLHALNDEDRHQTTWGLKYLAGFKEGVKILSTR